MLDFAKLSDLPALKNMWMQCFDEKEEDADFFFKNGFREGNTLIWRNHKNPVAMLTLMEVTLDHNPGFYIYAVATLPEYRRIGLMRKLDIFASEIIKSRGGQFSCLVPAESHLFPIYEALGYAALFQIKLQGFSYNYNLSTLYNPDKITFTSCYFEEFSTLRNSYLSSIQNSIIHSPAMLRFTYLELKFYGGNIVKYQRAGHLYYIAYSFRESSLLLRECSDPNPEAAIQTMLSEFNVKQAVLRQAFDPTKDTHPTKFGMYRSMEENHIIKNGYMALMLD